MKSYTVSENATLKEFTDNHCAQASFCFRALLKAREIRVNGERVGRDVPLKAGDSVCYYMTAAQQSKKAFTELYRDENVIVLDKESGVHSEAVFCALAEEGECYFVHRLDRNTAGVMIFARNGRSNNALLAAFRLKRVEKIYYALVCGKMKQRHAVEEAFLLKDERAARVRITKDIGERIVTEYEVLEERGELSFLKITLHTGKTHQIRAHFSYLGHPVLGDEKYGNEELNRKYHATRQRLIAKELTLHDSGDLAYLDGKTFASEKNL